MESDMRVNSVITLKKEKYALTGLLMHQGDNPGAGHWIAIAKHACDFFIYNDSSCTRVDAATLHCSMKLSVHESLFDAAALMYERIERCTGLPNAEIHDNERSAFTNHKDSVFSQ